MTKAGLLAFVAATAIAQQLPPTNLAWVDRAGSITKIGAMPRGSFAPRISPDGRKVAFDMFDGTVWTADLANVAAPVKFGPGRFPMWSADGKRILFTGPDGMRLFWQSSDGSGSPELLSDTARAPESWSTAAELVSYITLKEGSAGRDYDIWVFSPGDRATRPLIELPATSEQSSRFSPDGKWLAYQSNETGKFEVYVEPFPRTGVKTRVSNAGGERPVWSPDGKEIVYDQDQTLYSVSFSPAPTPRVEPPVALPIKGFFQAAGRRVWDIAPDGKRFLVTLP